MTEVEQHKERPHSRFGASAAYRFTVCTASVLASTGIPSYSSDFAREGTAGHEIAQACLENEQDAIEWVGKVVDGFTVDVDNWAEPLQIYINKCRRYMGPGWIWWIEKPITLDKLNPPEPMYGTGDFIAYHAERKVLVVVDLKFGRGIGVEAKGNPQLKYYALGALLSMPDDMPVEKIEAYIIQPRIPYGQIEKEDEYDPLALAEWSVWLLEKVRVALSPEAEYKPGSHCRFCPKSGRCIAQAEAALEFAKDEFALTTIDEFTPPPVFPEPRVLTPAQIAGILNAKEAATAFFKAVEEAARDGIHRGWLHVPGWMVTETESKDRWASADDNIMAARLKKAFGLTDEEVYKRDVVSPAVARSAVKGKLRDTGLKAKDAEAEAKKAIEAMLASKVTTGVKLVPVASGKQSAKLRGEEFPLLEFPV
jgi:hypothetical protein